MTETTAQKEARRAAARQQALAKIAMGPTGYFWALQATHATPEQLAIGKSADEEIKGLRAIIRKLGGGEL
jgi:hypothetical protein